MIYMLINPTVEATYWRDNYATQPWVERNYKYDDYEPAFRTGWEGYSKHASSGKTFGGPNWNFRPAI